MSNLIIPAAGAIVGAFIGGPTGAQVGWVAGSAIQASRTKIDQRSIGDLRVETSQYGVIIPYCVGAQRVTGNIIFAEPKKVYTIETRAGKGGPKVQTTGYTISMLIGICAGPILGVSRIWSNGKLIIDSRTTAKKTIGQLYLGDLTQTADPMYQSSVGAANAPAYRGLAYYSLTDYDLGASGQVPQFSFEIIKNENL